MGLSIFLGGLKYGLQHFSRSHVGLDATMTILAVIAISVPSVFNAAIEPNTTRVEDLSLSVAAAMLLIYILSIIYGLKTRTVKEQSVLPDIQPTHTAPKWSMQQALGILVLAVIGIAVMSEFLVGSVEAVTATLNVSAFFLGIIIIPIIGNIAEHLVAVQVARKNQMDLSLAIALGSSLQIALFVAPVLVFCSLLMGHPLTLEFNSFELIALTSASIIAAFVALDGESNWLEGAMLLGVYTILGAAFYFL